jgi:peptidyl-prolyl cis-trans isomerase A (cyclophilin A)
MSSLLERLFKRGMRTADPGPKGEGRPPVPYGDERRRSARGIAADADEGVSAPSRPEVCPLEPRLFLAATTLAGFADLALNENQSAFSMTLAGHFDDPAIVGTLVNINTVMGVIPVELFNVQVGAYTAAPLTVANFLHHANHDPLTSTTYYSSYDNTIFHRSAPGSVDPVTHLDPTGQPGFVIQGGGYDYPNFTKVTEGPMVANEYSVTRSNLRGTVAMAKLGTDPNSATNQFFINLSDNSGNLDNQNGGFTVFGHVLGSGMDVADAMAALPVYDGTGIDSAFDNLPLRNTPPAQAGPNNIVLINSIRVVDKLTYTATTDAPTLLSLSVSGTGLTINFMPNQTGTAHITIRATDVGGTYTESTFAVAVNTAVNPPSIQSLGASPDPFQRGAELTLTAKSVTSFPGKTLTKVEFFRDSNGNGILEPGTDQYLGDGTKNTSDWTIQLATVGWTAGPTKFFARAQDSSSTGSSPSAVTALVVNIPPSLTKIFTMGTLLRNQTGYISCELLKNLQYPNYSYSDAWDANADTISFRVEKISSGTMTKDGQPVVEGVTIFGPGEYVTWAPAQNADGTLNAFQVRAWDGTAASDKPIQIKIIVDKPPTISGVAVTKTISMPGGAVTLVAGANDSDGKVAKVEFFYDTNANGTFDDGTDLKLGEDTKVLGNWALTTTNTTTFTTGVARFFVRATDNVGGTSAIYTVTSFVNTPPTIASVTASGPVDRGDSILLTAANVTDAGTGAVTGVQFFRDVNADGKITTADKLLGSGKLVEGTSNWALTTSTAGWAAGGNGIIARATDNNGGTSTATGTATTTNHAPTASNLKVITNPVSQPGGTLKLTAAAKDIDGTIAKVMFFYDLDKNGLLEMPNDIMLGQTLVGAAGVWTLVTTNTAAMALGDARYFAVAVDNDGATSTPIAIMGTVNTPPVIDSVTTSGPVLRGSKLTLTAMNVHDVGAGNAVKKVEFFRDVNGNNIIDAADKLVGAGAVVAGTSNYSLSISTAGLPVGEVKFLARATDNNGGMTTSAAATTTITNNLPTLASLAASAATVKRGTPVTLTAKGPADVDGKVAKVEFFWDTNGNGVFDAGTDLKIGEDTNSLGGYTLAYMVPPTADLGAMRFFARATDNDGGVGAPVSIAITATNVIPTVGTLTIAPNPVTKPANLTLTAATVANLDGDGLIQRIRFYQDVNKNNLVDAGDRLLGEDTDGSDGWSLTIPSSDVMGTGAVRYLAVADDNDGGSSVPKVGNSTINP